MFFTTMKHIYTIDCIMRAKISNLRQALGKDLLKETPLFTDDFSLLRLIVWNHPINEVIAKFKKLSNMLDCLKLNDLPDLEEFDDINNYAIKLYPYAKYFPSGLMGYDKEGNVVMVQVLANASPKELIKCGRVFGVYHVFLIDFILAYKLLKKQERKHNKRLGVKIIFDAEGWNMDMLHMPSAKIYMNLMQYMQEMFPEVTKSLIVINAPFIMPYIYKILKPALKKSTREKVVIYGSDYKDFLITEIGADHLFEKWGGTIKPKNGIPTGTLRIGAHPPEQLKYDPSKNPYHIEESKLTKINIPHRRLSNVTINVERQRSHLRWFFTSSGEIDFSIKFGDKLVWPQFRLSTEFVPEYGSIACDGIGTYMLVFDNTFSMFTSKDVKFYVYVE